ncbi:pyroglutamyl-peptidase I [Lysobacter enzymogenes]|uniref:pyroglutamyl-peptidase I n=1 Tax=Lysobacter enzymogenes TaxID=69 RepID=UPI00099B913E|nr:pyroglutamyl-peptidase I [Lysobacter enzymogenes]UZW62697.1 pyroglutamyl-peptidase I [Lysobacter enzymogenes]
MNADFDQAPVLLTGFAPFGGEASNPSWEAVQRLHGERIGGRLVVAHCLPVAYAGCLPQLRERLDALRPALVLCIGQAGGRAQLSIERIAINVDDARIPDNQGRQPIDEPVIAGGPAAYFSSLPIKALRAALHEAGIPAEISQSAGTYLCNHVFYGLLHELHLRGDARVRGGFIHIPYSPAQAARHAGAPSLDGEHVVRALRVMVETALTTHVDRRLAGGAEH